jgi:creatinine amidohydrolase
MSWMQVAEYLKKDDLAVLPLGSTEQHCYLSLSVDSILSSKVAEDAAAPLGIPVYPVMAYGLAHHWTAYPGTVTLCVETYLGVVRDILDSIRRAGFRRILIVNGHGGNSVAGGMVNEWMMDNPDSKVKWHDWWNAPKTWAQVLATDPQGSHASWMENFPWTRLEGVAPPEGQKPMTDMAKLRILSPAGKRELVGDGNMGGKYQRSDAEMLALWDVAVKETRELLEKGWD